MTSSQKETLLLNVMLLVGATAIGYSNDGIKGAMYNFGLMLVIEVIFYRWLSRGCK